MILTLDIGTSSLKAGILDRKARLLSFVKIEIENFDYLALIKKAIESLGDYEIEAIIVDGNGPTLFTYPLSEPLFWYDQSASKQANEIEKVLGYRLNASFFLPKILKIKEENPSLYQRTKYFFNTQDYVNFLLTEKATVLMPLEGLERWYWCERDIDLLNLDKEKFPPFIKMGQIIGPLKKEVALSLGLDEKTLVVAGCPDFVTSIIGTSCMQEGMVADRMGTSEGLNYCSKTPNYDDLLMCYGHPNGQSYNISGIISNCGNCVQKALELLNIKDFDEFYSLAGLSSPGSNGVIHLPYLNGERAPIWDDKASSSFTNISFSTTKADLARSVLEGICLATKDVLVKIGKPVNELRITGIPSQRDLLCQMKADVCQVKITTIESQRPELLGLGIIALTALGYFENLSQAAEALVKTKKTYYPDKSQKDFWERRYLEFKATYKAQVAARIS